MGLISATFLGAAIASTYPKRTIERRTGIGTIRDNETEAAGRTVQRWQREGGLEVAPEEFWALAPDYALVLPVPDGVNVNLLYVSDLGENHPLVYFMARAEFPTAQELNYQEVSWTLEPDLITLTVKEPIILPALALIVGFGILAGGLAYWLSSALDYKKADKPK